MEFWAYWRAVLKRFWKDLLPRVEWVVVAILVGSITAWLLDKFALAGAGQVWLRILVAAIPACIILFVYALVHAARAPWKVHQNAANKHSEEIGSLSQDHLGELGKLRDAAEAVSEEYDTFKLKTQENLGMLAIEVSDLRARLALDGPQLWLSWKDNAHSGLYIENRKAPDALNVSIMPVETATHSLGLYRIPLLAHGIPAIPLELFTIDKSGEFHGGGLKDFVSHLSPSETEPITVFLVLYWSDHRGVWFERDISLRGSLNNFWSVNGYPIIEHSPIRIRQLVTHVS